MLTDTLRNFEPKVETLRDGRNAITRSYLPKDLHSCLSLRNHVYGRPFSQDEWLWKYGDNCPYPHDVLIAESGGRIVGMQAMIAFPFKIKGEILNALSLLDLMIHQKWRGQGLFLKMVKRIEDELLKSFDFFYSFPNKRSYYGFIHSLKWGVPFHPTLMTRMAFPHSMPEPSSKPFERSESNIQLIKDEKYLKWRYSKPNARYKIIDNTSVLAFQQHLGLRIAFVAEFTSINRKHFLMKRIEDLSKYHPLVFLVNSTSATRLFLKSKGFSDQLNLIRRFHLVVKTRKENKALIKKLSSWEISFGDFDVL